MRSDTRQQLTAKALFAGVHLSGSNANKTSLVILEGPTPGAAPSPQSGAWPYPLKIVKVYEKIGSFGSLFSDERLAQLLTIDGPFAHVFIDCPLTVPPCVACVRPVCPGAVKCDDVSVAYMLKVSSRLRRRGARKARPINPQSQRLWDVLQLDTERAERLEPSYSANLAPLVARARTLQRRLNSLSPRIELRETSVSNVLEVLEASLRFPQDIKMLYRSFEDGLASREEVIDRLLAMGWLEGDDDVVNFEQLSNSVETFHAFVCAWVGAMHHLHLTRARPVNYVDGEGWVHLPELAKDDGEPLPS